MASLQLVHGSEGTSIELSQPEITVGRRGAVVLLHLAVSHRHTRFLQAAGAWWVEDLESHNGTYLNGERLAPRVPVPMCDGDQVMIPGFVYAFRDELRPGEEPVIVPA